MTAEPSTPAEPPAAAPRPLAARLLRAGAIAVVGFAAIWLGTWALGYGRDIHPLRVAVTLALLLPVGLVRWAERVRSPAVALGTGLTVLILAATTWWETPAGMNGLTLHQAVKKRDALLREMGPVQYEDVIKAGRFRDDILKLGRHYPNLAEQLRSEFTAWGADAAAAVVEKLRDTPPHSLDAARSAASRGEGLARTFPEFSKTLVDEYESWLRRANYTLIDELNSMPSADWDAFTRTAIARNKHSVAFAGGRTELVAAENRWVGKSAEAATVPALRELETNPGQVRAACRNSDERVRNLPSLKGTLPRFRETRIALFRVAHDAATREVHARLHAKEFDRAFEVALQHGFEWALTTKALGKDQVKALGELREHARHLAIRFEKAGIVDLAPEPRGREIAPPPRHRSEAFEMRSSLTRIAHLAPQPEGIRSQAPDAANERKQLEEALAHIRDKKYLFAVARLGPLAKSATLPAAVTKAIPGLIDDLRSLDAAARLAGSPANEKLPAVSAEHLPASMKRPLAWLELLRAVSELLESRVPEGTELPWGVPQAEKLLAAIAADFDGEIASRLRVELSARLFLLGRPQEATDLLERDSPSEHARQVLEDLRVIVVGGGPLTNPQVARFVPENGLIEMPGVQALMPTAFRVKWQRPKPPAATGTTLEKLEKRIRADVVQHAGGEVERLSKLVNEAAGAIQSQLRKP